MEARSAGRLFTRRAAIRKLTALSGGLIVAASIPKAVEAAGHSYYCGAPFGPMHRFLYATAPDPEWQDAIIWRESNWVPYAKNPYSTAAGLAQFLDSTWAWGSERFGIYGSPYEWQTNILMMNAFVAAGERYHWNL